jgi:Flp pilus assembly protein TadD
MMPRPIYARIGALCLLATLCACASNQPKTPPPQQPQVAAGLPQGLTVTPAFEPIYRAAIEQARKPVPAAAHIGAPPGFPQELVTPIPADDPAAERASAELPDLLERMQVHHPAQPPHSATPPPQRERALRRYISGRQRLLAGDAHAAIPDLKAASELDPGAVEPMRELGEAHLAAGNRSEALAAFKSTVVMGYEDPRLLELLGRDALDRDDTAEAARCFARALAADPAKSDPLLPVVIHVQLAKSLAQEGYLRAARQAITHAFEGRAQVSSSTRYSAEFGVIYRRQGELWREAGDLDLRLGNYAQALDAYARASTLPIMDGVGILPRLIYAATRAGRPSAAAIYVLEGIAARRGRILHEDVAHLSHLAQVPAIRQSLADALEQYRLSLASDDAALPPTINRGLTRLQASIARPDQARQILRAHVQRDPTDLHGLASLLATHTHAAAIAKEAARCAELSPASAPYLAEALLRLDHAVTIDDLAALRNDSALLVAAYLAINQGDPRTGSQLIGKIAAKKPDPNIELARAHLAFSAGTVEPALAALGTLQGLNTPHAAAARARVLQFFQRTRAALDAIQPALAPDALSPSERMLALLAAADLAANLRLTQEAESYLLRAAELDPHDDRPLSELLDLYTGTTHEQAKVNQLVRQLRHDFAESRTMRLLRIREMHRRGMLDAAESEALELVQEEPSDLTAIRLLMAIWEQKFRAHPAAVDEARQWVRAALQKRRYSPPYLMALTVIEMSAGTPAAAEEPLRSAWHATGHIEIARMLERLLRETLGRGTDADTLTAERLLGRELSPAEAIELAGLRARQKRLLDAIAALRDGLPEDVTLTPDQAQQVTAIATAFGREAVQKDHAEHLALSAWLFDRILALDITLAPDDHEVRLVTLARLPDAAADQLLAAAALTAAQHPQLGISPYIRTTQALLAAERMPLALDFIVQAVQRQPNAGVELWFEWFRVLVFTGEDSDLRRFIQAGSESGRLPALVNRLREGQLDAVNDFRAEAAYLLGNYMSALNRRPQAEQAYVLAIEFDANHAWACNNLGYALADRGENIPLAEQLLERAHAALPNEGSILDSLGWLRYKQGILEDEVDPNSRAIIRKGALSLLLAAARTPAGKDNPTILDHLADALWLAGRGDEAIHHWQLAQNRSMRRIQLQRPTADSPQGGPASDAALQEYQDILNRSFLKRTAAAGGEYVPVASQLDNPRPSPPPTAAPATPIPTDQGAAIQTRERLDIH